MGKYSDLRYFEIMLFSLTLCSFAVESQMVPCDPRDRSSLLRLKHDLVYDSSWSQNLVTWNSSSDCCVWSGVACDADGHVIDLDLDDEFVYGGIHDSDSPLFDLHHLRSLHLSGNDFNGTSIPSGIGKLINLQHLDLFDCDFGGQVPIELSSLTSLLSLNLSHNYLKPTLLELVRNMTRLTELRLDFVNMSGYEWSHALSSLPHLQVLSLAGCSLSGTLPISLVEVQALSYVDLRYNDMLSGTLPDYIGDMTSLRYLHLDMCRFNGSITHIHWENLENLVELTLEYNAFSGNIPLSLFSLPSLEVLALNYNEFSGQVHEFSTVHSSSKLRFLYLESNKLEGPIPTSFFNLSALEGLFLAYNNFSGVIDLVDLFQHFVNLQTFDISFNSLSIIQSVASATPRTQLSSILMASCNLKTFPSMFRNQSILQELNMAYNNIVGEIPTWIWKPNLRSVNLSHNLLLGFKGHAPNLTSLSDLWSLDLNSNLLQGSIPLAPLTIGYLDYSNNNFSYGTPSQVGNYTLNLEFFSLSNNNFHGSIPISLCNISIDTLTIVDFSKNSFSGKIHPCLVSMGFRVLNLKENNLNGNIPDTFQDDCQLKTLDLSDNQLEGAIPNSLANCKELQVVNMGNNELTDKFPCWLMHMSSLRVLVLRSNKLYGSVRCEVRELQTSDRSNLQIIDISTNNFNGKLNPEHFEQFTGMMAERDNLHPKVGRLGFESNGSNLYYQDTVTIINKGFSIELEKILTIFMSIDFSCNNFEGPVPISVGDLKSLYALNLSHNHFTGQISSSIGNLKEIESLDLAYNNLSGVIPEQLASLTFLSYLNLSHNQLVGKIPTSTQLQSFSKWSYTGNKGLYGPPLEMICTYTCGSHVSSIEPTSTHDGKEINWMLICTEIGYVVGLGVVIGSLWFWRRWRLWYFECVDRLLFKIFPRIDPSNRKCGRKAYLRRGRKQRKL